MTYFSSFKGKKIILTGHTGFKGSWLAIWLKTLGANVVGLGLEPTTIPSHFNAARIIELIEDHRFDITNAELVRDFVCAVADNPYQAFSSHLDGIAPKQYHIF